MSVRAFALAVTVSTASCASSGPAPDAAPLIELSVTPSTTASSVAAAPAPATSEAAPPGELAFDAACDPVTDRCGEGTRCDSTCMEGLRFACVRAEVGSVPHGGACGSTKRCARGTRCVYPSDSDDGTCRRYCDGDGDCPNGLRCVATDIRCEDDTATLPFKECR